MKHRVMVLKNGSTVIYPCPDLIPNYTTLGKEFIQITSEEGEYHKGNFLEGMAISGIRFRKSDCRAITKREYAFLNKASLVDGKGDCIGGGIYIDQDGYFIEE